MKFTKHQNNFVISARSEEVPLLGYLLKIQNGVSIVHHMYKFQCYKAHFFVKWMYWNVQFIIPANNSISNCIITVTFIRTSSNLSGNVCSLQRIFKCRRIGHLVNICPNDFLQIFSTCNLQTAKFCIFTLVYRCLFIF